MNGSRTEQPTPKHIREARQRGVVAFSTYLTGTLALLLAVAVITQTGTELVRQYADWAGDVFASAGSAAVDPVDALKRGLGLGIRGLLPFFVVLFLATAVIGWIHIGPRLSFRAVMPSLHRLNVVRGFRRLLRINLLGRFLFDLLVSCVLLGLAFFLVIEHLAELANAPHRPIGPAFMGIWSGLITSWIGWALTILLLAGGLDWVLKRWQLLKQLSMTRAQVEQERREQSGDPLFRAQRRRLYEQLGWFDTAAALDRTTCLITSSHQLAVGLSWDVRLDEAPLVVLKGSGLSVPGIEEESRNRGIPSLEDPEMTVLLQGVQVGRPIPETLYEPVAKLLAKMIPGRVGEYRDDRNG